MFIGLNFILLFFSTPGISVHNPSDRNALRDAPISGNWTHYLDDENWTAVAIDANDPIPASVPGDVISDLYAAGKIDNPLYELNFKNSTSWDRDWVYTVHFEIDPMPQLTEILLIFDGVKMGARAMLNGKLLGEMTDQFLRYQFPVKSTGALVIGHNNLTVTFEQNINCHGRWMACTGGWDWAPYSNTSQSGAQTFSKGIWKSVYLVGVNSVVITHLVPHVRYKGAYPASPLTEKSKGDFEVTVRIHIWAPTAGQHIVHVTGEWGQHQSIPEHKFPSGHSNVTVILPAPAKDVKLWWPAGTGKQQLYNVSVVLDSQAEKVAIKRRIGFRTFALVTGNDTDPSYVKRAATEQGTELHGMYFRVNGGLILSRGANMIPMEEMEGWMHAGAHVATVRSAMHANFNTIRVWGGGMYLPQIWYDTCDELGILVFHDMMYAQKGHAPLKTATQDAELRHQIRRLSHHPSIIIWDGCNECTVAMSDPGTSIYATFVMTVVAEEDKMRVIWPSCPAKGWSTGVHKLTSMPNGKALTTPDKKSQRCTTIPGAKCIEVHRPKWQGSGFPAVNGRESLTPFHTPVPWPWNFAGLFPSNIPLNLTRNQISPALQNNFSSESPGGTVFSSFESMSATLDPSHWGIHAGQPWDTCHKGPHGDRICEGGNVMAERNYPCDNFIIVYFGKVGSNVNATGELAFKQQLYQCMIAQALLIKQNIEWTRSMNRFGILVWQFNEIWPTGGWGSIEYGNPNFPGQSLGGRWKPLQYWYRSSIFSDVIATCDNIGLCYIRNDAIFPFSGFLTLNVTEFATSQVQTLMHKQITLPAGAGKIHWFEVPAIETLNGSLCILEAVVITDSGTIASSNVVPFVTPEKMVLHDSSVTVNATRHIDGNLIAEVRVKSVAMYVTLTTRAHGRFEDNAFLLRPPGRQVKFLPEYGLRSPVSTEADFKLFSESLRVEDVSTYRSFH